MARYGSQTQPWVYAFWVAFAGAVAYGIYYLVMQRRSDSQTILRETNARIGGYQSAEQAPTNVQNTYPSGISEARANQLYQHVVDLYAAADCGGSWFDVVTDEDEARIVEIAQDISRSRELGYFKEAFFSYARARNCPECTLNNCLRDANVGSQDAYDKFYNNLKS